MPRFVLLRHETPDGYPRPAHFDLMLECGPSLRTWACPAVPTIGQEQLAEELADHRLDYLDYEGEVSGSRGSVQRVAAGHYELLAESADSLRVRLSGDALSGDALAGELTLTHDTAAQGGWRISLAPPR